KRCAETAMAWINPTTPNLTDYLSFLYGVVGIPSANFPSVGGTASGGSTSTLTDASQTWTANQWNGYDVYDTTQGVQSTVSATAPTTVTFSPAFTNPVLAGDGYLIAGVMLSTTFNVAMEIVSTMLNMASPTIYTLAVYNLAADRLVTHAADVPDQTYFEDLRTKLGILNIMVGFAAQVSDQGT